MPLRTCRCRSRSLRIYSRPVISSRSSREFFCAASECRYSTSRCGSWRSMPSWFSDSHQKAEAESGLIPCGTEFSRLSERSFYQTLRDPRMRALSDRAAAAAAHPVRLCRQPRCGERAHRLDGHGPHTGKPGAAGGISGFALFPNHGDSALRNGEVQDLMDHGRCRPSSGFFPAIRAT